MDPVELTIEQRAAQAQIEMFKNFRLIIVLIMAITTFSSGFGVYSSWAESKKSNNFVLKSDYEKERQRDAKEQERLYEKLDKILSTTEGSQKQITELHRQISIINEREKMREKYSKAQGK